jgi:hypothetical protein
MQNTMNDPYRVPCNGCTLCCHGDAVRILPGEDHTHWHTVPHDSLPGERMLAHHPNGDCVYLGTGGCNIHDDKPLQCGEMDCRRIAQSMSWTQARKLSVLGRLPLRIWRRGRDLLRSQ